MSGTREEEETEEVDQDEADVDGETQGRIFRFARKLMDRKDLGVDTRELLHSMAVTSDKAKTEAMKLIAREVRNYLDEMHLEDLIHQVLQSYSVEVSIRLNPLSDAPERTSEDKGKTSVEPPAEDTPPTASEEGLAEATASEPT